MKYWWLLFLTLLSYSAYSQQYVEESNMDIDSLQAIAENEELNDSIRIDAYINWDNMIYVSDPKLDLKINKKIVELCDKNLKRNNLTERELIIYVKCKTLSLNNLGLINFDFGDYLNAQNYFQASYNLAESTVDSTAMANALNNLGMIFKAQGDFEKSKEYYERSMVIDPGNDYSKSIYLNNIGLCYVDMLEYDTALEYYYESLFLSRRCGYRLGEGNTVLNIGLVKKEMEEYDSALYYFDQALIIYQEVDNTNGKVNALIHKGLSHYKRNEANLGIYYCSEALETMGNERLLENRVNCHDCLYKSYKLAGKINQSLIHYELKIKFKDSLWDREKSDALVQQQFNFQHEKQRVADSLNFAKEQELSDLKIREQEAQIQKSFTQKLALFGGLALVVLFALFIYKRLRITRFQKIQIESQKDLLQEKNQEILDSITYAKRIQEAILPPDSFVKNLLTNSFILYKPKDIVAGDFYWFEQIGDNIIFAAADCTGHGVPGAMVSVVCHNALNRAIREFALIHPNDILNKTRELVIETFEKSDKEVKDGMDISLCVLNKKTQSLEFAGANNGLCYVRDNELTEIKPDKQPIGKHLNNQKFTLHQLKLQSNDVLYLFSDGFADQFGGIKGKKFKYQNLKNLLLKNSQLVMEEQCSLLENAFEDWKGELEQLDDVCVIGVRV